MQEIVNIISAGIVDRRGVTEATAYLLKRIYIARTVDAKSPWTAGHSERVTSLSLKIGKALGLTSENIDILHRGGLLHDIGKIGIPNSILNKPAKLEDNERILIMQHPEKGALILEPIKAYAEIIPVVVQHHEWFNGHGYPRGLKGDDIYIGARILAVADVYDALSSDRPYRAGWDKEVVIAYLREKAGLQFDPEVVRACEQVISEPFADQLAYSSISNYPERGI